MRILDGAGATGAVTRVLLDATDGERDWTTIGVSANIIEASWRALEESLVYGLLHASGGGDRPDRLAGTRVAVRAHPRRRAPGPRRPPVGVRPRR